MQDGPHRFLLFIFNPIPPITPVSARITWLRRTL